MRRSDYTYNVRHSPLLILDSKEDRLIETGGEVWNATIRSHGTRIMVNGDVALDSDDCSLLQRERFFRRA